MLSVARCFQPPPSPARHQSSRFWRSPRAAQPPRLPESPGPTNAIRGVRAAKKLFRALHAKNPKPPPLLQRRITRPAEHSCGDGSGQQRTRGPQVALPCLWRDRIRRAKLKLILACVRGSWAPFTCRGLRARLGTRRRTPRPGAAREHRIRADCIVAESFLCASGALLQTPWRTGAGLGLGAAMARGKLAALKFLSGERPVPPQNCLYKFRAWSRTAHYNYLKSALRQAPIVLLQFRRADVVFQARGRADP